MITPRRVYQATIHFLASLPVALLVCELATKAADERQRRRTETGAR